MILPSRSALAQQKNIAEIAKEIRRSEGAVKQLQFRGLRTYGLWWVSDETVEANGETRHFAGAARPGD
jgi:hypothetical protein